MGSFVTCPFCGQRGRRTKEHVWAQWLHDTPGADYLRQGSHGERISPQQIVMQLGQDGRYGLVDSGSAPFAELLPNLTVAVCSDCNNGWMSRLEQRAKRILRPFVFQDLLLTLESDELKTIATWATKSSMSYALIRPSQHNPFTETEYRAIAADPAPLDRSHVWMFYSEDPGSHVAMHVSSGLITPLPASDHLAPDNAGFAMISLANLVLFLAFAPLDAPSEMLEVMAPELLTQRGIRRIWPDARRQYFPLEEPAPGTLSALVEYSDEIWRQIGLPIVGLNEAEAADVSKRYLDGEDARDLRAEWEEPG